jgi:hypothetical protein
MTPHAQAEDDDLNLFDLGEAIEALESARDALRKGQDAREKFIFDVGFARGRLARVSDRIYASLAPQEKP